MDNCHLIRPDALWLLLPLLFLLWLLSMRRGRAGSWRKVCDSALLPYILQGRESKTSIWPLLLTAVGGIVAIIALSGPACEELEQPVFRDQSALVIALDLSRSMDATDINPSRLSRARLKIIDILKQRREGQTALIVYAAQAFTVSPLTDDAHTIIAQVSSLDSNLMPLQGSKTEVAVAKASQLLQQAGVAKGDILLITDGIEEDEISATLNQLNNQQHTLSVLAVGTAAGAPIARRDGGFLHDKNGAIVIPKLIKGPLQQLAQKAGGRYHLISNNDADINYLLAGLSEQQPQEQEAVQGLASDQWREEGPWLLLILIPLAALAFRRGYLAVFIIVLLPIPNDAYALDLWLNQEQQAEKLLQQGEAEQAAEKFQSPEWKAAAHYRAGQYQQAVDALQDINTVEALYNKGNALARMGKLDEAIKAYDEALKQSPEHEDAKYNRELLKKQQQQNQSQQQSDGDQSGDQQQQGDSPDQGEQQQSSDGQQQTGEQNEQSAAGEEQKSQDAGQQQDDQGEQTDASQAAQEKDSTDESEEKMPQQAEEDAGETDEADKQIVKPEQDYSETTETDIATEQWLRRIPDDPGGLLRRKFQYQYQRQQQNSNGETEPW